MASYNKIILIGNLGRDPEIRITDGSKKATSFSLAVNDSYTDRNGNKVEKTEWFRITFWGPRGETAAQYLKKGMQVYVEGRLSTSTYTDQNGQSRFSLDVLGSEFQMLDRKQDSEQYGQSGGGESRAPVSQATSAPAPVQASAPLASPADFASSGGDDDLPF
jgi:single-strand DNA-binding protein